MACTSTIKQFDNNSFSRFHNTYIYTKYFENHQSDIWIKSNNQFLCSRTRYIKTKDGGSDGIEESIGSGYIVIEKGQLILRNNDCKIKPPFKELRCYITVSSGIGTETIIRCKNEKGIEYFFWDLEK